VSWASAYPEFDPADVLTPRVLEEIESLESRCETAQAFSGRPTKDIFAADPRNVAAWNKRIEASRVKRVPFPAFFVVAQTSASHVQEIRKVAQRLCRVSDAVRFDVYPGTNHDGVLQAALPDYIAWMADRFGGVPASGNCGE
jgi:hypothetical protein